MTSGPAFVRNIALSAMFALGGPVRASAQADTVPARPDTTLAQEGIYDRPFITSVGRTAIGGYLEGTTNYFKQDGIGDGFTMEMTRFNIFLFSSVSSRVRFISELEFEDGTREINIETALLDFRFNSSLSFRAGILLPPLGFFNQNHDGPKWEFVDRPLVSTEIIPSTLSEVGFGVFGKLFPGRATVSYDLYLTNGLQDGIVVNEEGRTHIPSGKSPNQFSEDNNGSPAVSGRLGVRWPGLGEVGGSFYTGHYNSFKVEGDRVDESRRVSIFALDAQTTQPWGTIRAEFALADVDVPSSLQEIFGDRQWGGHIDVTIPVWRPQLQGYPQASTVELGLRIERVDMNVGSFSSTGGNIFDDTTAIVPTVSFRPTDGTVFRVNYRREWHRDLLGNPTSVRAGYQFGLATYF